MTFIRLAIRNTRRQTRRTIYTGLAIGIAVATLTFLDAYLRGALESIINSFIRLDAGHVKILPTEAVKKSRPLPPEDAMRDISRILEIANTTPGVIGSTPRIKFGVLLDKPSGSVPAIGIGISPSGEKNLMQLEQFIIQGRIINDSSYEVVLGSELAEDLGKTIGEELFMVARDAYGGLGPGLYTICGISKTGVGMIDRRMFYIPLSAAQEQLALEDAAAEVVCRLENGMESAEEIALKMNESLRRAGHENISAVPWQQQSALFQMVSMIGLAKFLMMFLLAIIALTTVINTVLMSVMERTREIGALRALGFDRGFVLRMILAESLTVGTLGTIFGIVLGMGVSILFHYIGIDLSGSFSKIDFPMRPIIYPHPVLFTAIQSAIFGLVVSLIAAWYPARKAVRLDPAQALRTN